MKTNICKNFLLVALIIFCFTLAGSASAAATINGVWLNGSTKAAVAAGSNVTVTITATLTNPSVWKSTAYRFGNGNWVCVHTPEHQTNTTATEAFSISAPAKQGTGGVAFNIYGNNDCTDSLSATMLSASLAGAVMNMLSLGTGKTWLSVIFLLLIIIIIVLVIFYINKKISDKKTSQKSV